MIAVIRSYTLPMEETEDEVEIKKLKDELREILNIQNSAGNTILHESVIAERQTMTEKLRRLGLIDESIKNNENKTARDIENTIKEEKFRESVEKQKQITE